MLDATAADDMEGLNRALEATRNAVGHGDFGKLCRDEVSLILGDYDRMKAKLEKISEGKTVLLMSDEDRAKTALELDDVSLAKWARTVLLIYRNATEKSHLTQAMAGVIGLALATLSANAGQARFSVEGITYKGEPKGDWQVIVQQIGFADERIAAAMALLGDDGPTDDVAIPAALEHLHAYLRGDPVGDDEPIPFTVFAYTDGEKGVIADYWHVWANSKSEAFDKAVEQAKEDWTDKGMISERGVPIYGHDAEGLCELATVLGHIKPA